ncbi:MAG: hypothetical protein ABEI13_04060, partial [Candidatus Paceibacteria bacterium]
DKKLDTTIPYWAEYMMSLGREWDSLAASGMRPLPSGQPWGTWPARADVRGMRFDRSYVEGN